MSEVFNEIKEALTMQEVAEHFCFKISRAGFIRNPFREERTPSCKLYDRSYYDFGAACGGDLIQFTAAVLGVNNWEACKYLIEAFSLPISLSDSADRHEEIEQRKKERQQQQAREQRFNDARLKMIGDLHFDMRLWESALENKVFTPYSDQQRRAVERLQMADHCLDVLCGLTGCKADQEKILMEAGYAP